MPAVPNITFDESYFRMDFVDNPEPAGYSDYGSEYTYYDERPDVLAGRIMDRLDSIGLAGKKVLVVGCAYGYTVEWLVSFGCDAYGLDISDFAISQAPAAIASRVMVGDARASEDFEAAKLLAGLEKKNDKFDLVFDEDMIMCLTDAEAATFQGNALAVGKYLAHLYSPFPHLATYYNYHEISEWKTILNCLPTERWFARFGLAEV